MLSIAWLSGLVIYLSTVQSYNATPPKTTKADAIIVLTGGVGRIEAGLNLWAEGLAPELLITGVNKDIKKADILQTTKSSKKKLPQCCMTLGYKAQTTVGNAQEIKEWVQEKNLKSIHLVTSGYHLPRSMMEIKQTAPNLTIYTHSVPFRHNGITSQGYWKFITIEYHKNLVRRLQIAFDFIRH